jgi:hypothetical protein
MVPKRIPRIKPEMIPTDKREEESDDELDRKLGFTRVTDAIFAFDTLENSNCVALFTTALERSNCVNVFDETAF